jgi:hypothetical protein
VSYTHMFLKWDIHSEWLPYTLSPVILPPVMEVDVLHVFSPGTYWTHACSTFGITQ